MLFKSSVEVPEVHWRGLREMPGCLVEQPTPQARQRRPGNYKMREAHLKMHSGINAIKKNYLI